MNFIYGMVYAAAAILAVMLSATLAQVVYERQRKRRDSVKIKLLYDVYHAAWHMADNSTDTGVGYLEVLPDDFTALSEAMEALEAEFPPGENIHTLLSQLQ